MPVLSALNFCFNGQNSSDYNIFNIYVDNGSSSNGLPFVEPFLPSKKVLNYRIRHRAVPYFQGIQYDQELAFNLNFSVEGGANAETLRPIARWFNVEQYTSIWFDTDPTRIFYVIPQGAPTITHDGINAFISITLSCDGPWSYSNYFLSDIYDFSNNNLSGSLILFNNEGDYNLCPEIWILSIGSNNTITITNQSDDGIQFQFTGLDDQELIYVDNDMEYITTSVPGIYRYDNFNGNYLNLPSFSISNLLVTGNCKIRFRYAFKTLA